MTPPNRDLLTKTYLVGTIPVKPPPVEGEADRSKERRADPRPGPGDEVSFIEAADRGADDAGSAAEDPGRRRLAVPERSCRGRSAAPAGHIAAGDPVPRRPPRRLPVRTRPRPRRRPPPAGRPRGNSTRARRRRRRGGRPGGRGACSRSSASTLTRARCRQGGRAGPAVGAARADRSRAGAAAHRRAEGDVHGESGGGRVDAARARRTAPALRVQRLSTSKPEAVPAPAANRPTPPKPETPLNAAPLSASSRWPGWTSAPSSASPSGASSSCRTCRRERGAGRRLRHAAGHFPPGGAARSQPAARWTARSSWSGTPATEADFAGYTVLRGTRPVAHCDR